MAYVMPSPKQKIVDGDDPYADKDPAVGSVVTSRLGKLLREGFTVGGKQINLRLITAGEVGPEKFFFGSQTACILLAALFQITGLIPSLGQTKTLEGSWIAFVFIRNYVLMLIFYGGYHVLFYQANWGKKKFNPSQPPPGQHERDVLFTTITMSMCSAIEVVLLHGWANATSRSSWFGKRYDNLSDHPWEALALFVGIAFFNDFHFYIIHRALHIGPIYRAFHKLHHKSTNPGPWSGMSMHPVEGFAYISRIMVPLLFPHHILHYYFSFLNTVLMPVPGHSGYEEMLGNEYHWLHHHLFVVNFGSPAVPLDWWFGSHVAIVQPNGGDNKKGN